MTPPALDAAAWSRIDTVLLDLDGTLLDLVYDNHFWTVMVPEVWGRERGLDLATAQQRLRPRFQARQGTLDWYCIDFWSRELGLDIPAMKVADAHRVRWLPGAPEFLDGVRALGKRLVLLTNAHPMTLAIKDSRVQVTQRFDASFSAHVFGAPKEDRALLARPGDGRALRRGALPVRRRLAAGAARRARGGHRHPVRGAPFGHHARAARARRVSRGRSRRGAAARLIAGAWRPCGGASSIHKEWLDRLGGAVRAASGRACRGQRPYGEHPVHQHREPSAAAAGGFLERSGVRDLHAAGGATLMIRSSSMPACSASMSAT